MKGWKNVEDFGIAKFDLAEKFLPFDNGIPKYDTIVRMLSRLNSISIQTCFIREGKLCCLKIAE